jgi:hypothetical protein
MNGNPYHRVLLGLDQVLCLFNEASTNLSADEVRLKNQLEVIRSQVLKAESGHPFPFNTASAFVPGSTPDPNLTLAPWQTGG